MSPSGKVNQGQPTLDQVTNEIILISAAMKKLRETRLTDDTLFLLIQNAIGQSAATGYKQVPLKTIRLVIEGIESLDTKHLKKRVTK